MSLHLDVQQYEYLFADTAAGFRVKMHCKKAILYLRVRDIAINSVVRVGFGSKGNYALHQQFYFEANRYLVPILM